MGKIEQAREVLAGLGLPGHQQNEMSALTFLALCGLREGDPWRSAARCSLTITKGVMAFVRQNYGRDYAPNTRETFRRQVLHQFVQARVADYNPDDPSLPTNSPRAHYAVTAEALAVARSYGSRRWKPACAQFAARHTALLEVYQSKRRLRLVPLVLPGGRELRLSPGRHSEVQAQVVELFGPRFAAGARLVHLGDTANKALVRDDQALRRLRVSLREHGKLPDIVLWDAKRDWLFLIEVVTSHGPVTPKRLLELRELFGSCSAGKVFVSVFPDFREFARHIREIAWETEVWIAEMPDHLIHYNGDRFLGPR